MVRVGVVGLGMMGLTHLDVYRTMENVKIAAICDSDPARLSGQAQAAGNLDGLAQNSIADLEDVQRSSDIYELIGSPEIDLIDICLPTDMHLKFGREVLKAGQHLMMEKPFARNTADAFALADAAKAAKGITFVGHCMRFWPGWTWLKEAIDDQRFGKLCGVHFRRVASHPGGPFYVDGDRCGGAALDLHIHDTDFVQFCFGMPKAVQSYGYSKITNHPDHLWTRYEYDDIPLVTAEGCWAMAAGYPFNMGFTANFEQATAVYDLGAEHHLMLYESGKDPQPVEISSLMGYTLEIAYMIDCIEKGRQPARVTVDDAARTVKIVEAEIESVRSGRRVEL